MRNVAGGRRLSSRWIAPGAGLLLSLVGVSACSGAVATQTESRSSVSTTTTTAASEITSTTKAPDPAEDETQLAQILDDQTLAVTVLDSGQFVGVGDAFTNGEFTVVESVDGTTWATRSEKISGLPDDFVGPYRIWGFGEGHLIYGESSVGTSKPGATDPFVATSDDLSNWKHVEMPGIDELFYNGWQSTHGPGDVAADGSLAIFVEDHFVEGAGRQPNMWALKPNEDPVLINNALGIYTFTFVDGAVIGLDSERDRRSYRLWVLDGDEWRQISTPPASMQLGAEIRGVGQTLIYMNSAEAWFTRDLGVTWTQRDALETGIRDFGYFGPSGAAGPAHPPYGVPDTFLISGDGANWSTVALPEGAADIRHLVTTEDGILSLVKFTEPSRAETLYTPTPTPALEE